MLFDVYMCFRIFDLSFQASKVGESRFFRGYCLEMDNFGDGFIVDTGSAETLETTDKQLPIFNSSGYSIGIGNEEEENVVAKISQKSVPAIKDELFSLESMTIKEALDRCPYKPTFFCSDEENVLTKTKDKMEGAMLEGLQCYLEELKIKKYNFITDGIEAKKDITQLGMSANQLRKLNRVWCRFNSS